MLKVTRGPIIKFFIYEIIFSFFWKLFEHSNFGFFPSFTAPIFYNFAEFKFFEFLKLFF